MTHHESHNAEAEQMMAAEWYRAEGLLAKINTVEGGINSFFSQIPDLAEAFHGKRTHMCCIDERVVGSKDAYGKQFEAGCGILFPIRNVYERAEAVAENTYRKGGEVLCPHKGCGAAGLAFKADADADQIVERMEFMGDTDAYGVWFAELVKKHLDEKLKNHGRTASIKFMGDIRPSGFHNAIGAYFDTTGKFNPDMVRGELPKMFVVDGSNRELSETKEQQLYGLTQLRVAIGIALGNHGFGHHRFSSEEHRFLVPVVASSLEQLVEAQEKVKSFIQDSDPKLLDHLNIGGFVQPSLSQQKHPRKHGEAVVEV